MKDYTQRVQQVCEAMVAEVEAAVEAAVCAAVDSELAAIRSYILDCYGSTTDKELLTGVLELIEEKTGLITPNLLELD